jgi:hypothetical protein
VEANSTGGQGSRRAVAPSDDDNDEDEFIAYEYKSYSNMFRLTNVAVRECTQTLCLVTNG